MSSLTPYSKNMAKTIGIGYQNFEQLIQNDCFYVDKTGFIKK
jgi:Predicted AAA-ATPase.